MAEMVLLVVEKMTGHDQVDEKACWGIVASEELLV